MVYPRNVSRAAIAAASFVMILALLAFYLFVRSEPVPKDMIVGIVMLDKTGRATVIVPPSLTLQHRNIGYQARPMDAAMPGLYVEPVPQDDLFSIAGGTPGEPVAWQMVGIKIAN